MQLLRPFACLLLAAGLTGCSGTPFGDQLSRSFSSPPAQAPAPTPAAKPAAEAAKPTTTPTAPTTPPPAKTSDKPAPAPAASLTPAPYRVTIKLPAADPSSPAEAVTDALREAGVAFEVETIERVPAGTEAPAAPVRSPAPPAR
jgi:hypothetical protein